MEKAVIVSIVMGVTGEVPHKIYQSLNILDILKNIYLQIQKSICLDFVE